MLFKNFVISPIAALVKDSILSVCTVINAVAFSSFFAGAAVFTDAARAILLLPTDKGNNLLC